MHESAAQGKANSVQIQSCFDFDFLVYTLSSQTITMALGQRKGQSRVAIKTFDKCLEGCPIARKERASFHWYKIRQNKYLRLVNRIIKKQRAHNKMVACMVQKLSDTPYVINISHSNGIY